MQVRIARRAAVAAALVAVGIGVVAATGFGQGKSSQPVTAARFALGVGSEEIASFSELSGITTEITPADYLSSTQKEVVFKKMAGRPKPATITLKRGLDDNLSLWTWHEEALKGVPSARKGVSLTMYGTDGTARARYWLEGAWPSKLDITGVKAGGGEVLFETVTLVAEHIQRISR